jgi:hypothetical protein
MTTMRMAPDLAGHAAGISEGAKPTMLRFNDRQRTGLAAMLRDLANYGAAALVFGQFVGERLVSWRIAAGGLAIWVLLAGWALLLERE